MLKEQGRAGQSRAERADKRQGDYRTLNSFIIIKWKNEGEKRFYVKIVLSLSFLLFCVHKKIVWIDAEMRNGLNVATAADATLKFIDLRFTEHEWKRASKGKTTKILSLLWIYRAGCKLSSCQAFSSFFLFCVYVAIFFVSHFLSYLLLVGSSIIMRHKRILTNGIIGFGKLLCGRYKMIIIMTFTLCRKAIWKQNNCFDGTEDRGREREGLTKRFCCSAEEVICLCSAIFHIRSIFLENLAWVPHFNCSTILNKWFYPSQIPSSSRFSSFRRKELVLMLDEIKSRTRCFMEEWMRRWAAFGMEHVPKLLLALCFVMCNVQRWRFWCEFIIFSIFFDSIISSNQSTFETL